MPIWILEDFFLEFVKVDLINEVIGITYNNCPNEVQHMHIASTLPFLEKDYQKSSSSFLSNIYMSHRYIYQINHRG